MNFKTWLENDQRGDAMLYSDPKTRISTPDPNMGSNDDPSHIWGTNEPNRSTLTMQVKSVVRRVSNLAKRVEVLEKSKGMQPQSNNMDKTAIYRTPYQHQSHQLQSEPA